MARKENHNTEIIVALIALTGVIAAPLIPRIFFPTLPQESPSTDKNSPTPTATTTTTTTTTPEIKTTTPSQQSTPPTQPLPRQHIDKPKIDSDARLPNTNKNDINEETDINSQYKKGVALLLSNQYKSAMEIFEPIASAGDRRAQFQMGKIYLSGSTEIEVDYDEAYFWTKKAADQNLPDALHNLGVMYQYGQGVKKDKDMAWTYYTKAAKLGFIESQKLLTKGQRSW